MMDRHASALGCASDHRTLLTCDRFQLFTLTANYRIPKCDFFPLWANIVSVCFGVVCRPSVRSLRVLQVLWGVPEHETDPPRRLEESRPVSLVHLLVTILGLWGPSRYPLRSHIIASIIILHSQQDLTSSGAMASPYI